jgi:hypothetical protein
MVNIEKYNSDIVMNYIRTGKTESLPADVVEYIDMLELVRSMYDKYERKQDIVNMLMSPTYGLSRYKANQVFYESLNLFFADNNVKVEAWEAICAKRAEDLMQLAIAADDIETARKCLKDFSAYRGVGKEKAPEIPKEMYIRPVVIYTMESEQVGVPKADRRELAAFIDALPEINEGQRRKIKREAGVDPLNFAEDITEYEETKD